MPEQMWFPPPSEPRRLTPRLATSTERNRSHGAKGLADSTPKPTAGRLCYFSRASLDDKHSGCCRVFKFMTELPPKS